jgi:hypothetical protein
MSIADKILERVGLKYEDLKPDELETLNTWTQVLDSNQLTVGTVREFVHSLRDTVENELAKSDLGTLNDTFLKARLRNLMLLEAFLTSPVKAKEALERAIAGIVSNRKT